jgi:plasmid stabilization system protein ParE
MKVRFTRRAIGHINQIERDTLAAFGERVAGAFLARIERAAQNLAAFPLSGRPGRVEGTREILVPNTPFLIAYRIKQDEVHLLAVLHGARRWPSHL